MLAGIAHRNRHQTTLFKASCMSAREQNFTRGRPDPVAVSVPSFLFVPMTPVGPRLIQPHTYMPTTGSAVPGLVTRPASLGITPQGSWNGSPGMGTPRYPTERKDQGVRSQNPMVAVTMDSTHASRGCPGGTRQANRSRSSIGVSHSSVRPSEFGDSVLESRATPLAAVS